MNKKKKIICIVITVFIVIILTYLLDHILFKKDYEFLNYMEDKYGEKFELDSKVIGFPSFMYDYITLYGHAKKDKTMTFMGEYDFGKDNEPSKMYDNYNVTLLGKENAEIIRKELDKYFEKDFEIMCFPCYGYGLVDGFLLDTYKDSLNYSFMIFAEPEDYEKIIQYKNGNEDSKIDTLMNYLYNKYSNCKSELKMPETNYDSGKIYNYYSHVEFIKTKKLNKIRKNVLTEPNNTIDQYDYDKYVYKNDNNKIESIYYSFEDDGIKIIDYYENY